MGSQDTNTTSCSSFSVGSCYPDQEEVIDTFPLPPNLDDGPAVAVCQDICGVVEGCQYFSYSFSSGFCDLYHYRYLASCQVVGGPDYPSLDDCLDIGDTCDSFIQEDCSYTADIVLERSSLTNTHHCQDLLLILGDVLGAEYWVYDSNNHTCFLYSSQGRHCDKWSGPGTPDIRDCQSTTTATATTTTRASTTTTTTTATATTTTTPVSTTTTTTDTATPASTTTIRTTTTARTDTTTFPTTTTSFPLQDDFSDVILFNGEDGGWLDEETPDITYYVSEDSWCSILTVAFPLQYLSDHLLAVNYEEKIIACIAEGSRDCYLNEYLAYNGSWQKIASRSLSGFGSSYAVIGSTLIASNGGGFFDTNIENTLFEMLDLSEEDAEWVTVNLHTPNIPQ